MAEFVMKDLVHKSGLDDMFRIGSAAVSEEETGNPVYPPVASLLFGKGISVDGHRAHKITVKEFEACDMVVVMDDMNLRLLSGIVGASNVYGNPKVHKLMEFAGFDPASAPDVADPWYTRDFERSYRDILAGCKGLLNDLCLTDDVR